MLVHPQLEEDHVIVQSLAYTAIILMNLHEFYEDISITGVVRLSRHSPPDLYRVHI
jgi:hypothetical protein